MSVSVCFPYRPDHGRRDAIADWVTARWQAHFPDFELVRGEPDPTQPFNRSQGINIAVRRSHGNTLIVADLDTIFNPEDINAALDLIDGGALWGYAFRGYFNLTQDYTDFLMDLDPAVTIPLPQIRFEDWGFENVSGMTVIGRQAMMEVGGFDEEFKGWGVEDYAFDRLATHRLGEPFRVPKGYVMHLWHPKATVNEQAFARNQARFDEQYSRVEYLDRMPRWL